MLAEMVLGFVGVMSLVIPFVVLCPRLGSAQTLIFLLTVQLVIALSTQAIGIFTYPVVLFANLLFVGLVLYHQWGTLRTTVGSLSIRSVDWILLLVIAVSGYALHSVHYNYQGIYTTAVSNEYVQAEHLSYPYPYFPDEWYAIAFVEETIATGKLPLTNPLENNESSFVNLQFPFHALLAELVVLLRLTPSSDYTLLSVGMNTLLIVIMYLVMRRFAIPALLAGSTSVLALLITSGSNLPGLWTLIPFTVGVGFLLLSLSVYPKQQLYGALLTTFLYPPLALYSLVLVAAKRSIKQWLLLGGGIVALMGVFLLLHESGAAFLKLLQERLVYHSLLDTLVPQFTPLSVMPPILLFLAVVGLVRAWRTVPVLVSLWGMGLVLWLVYLFTPIRFLIGFERVVMMEALLSVILAGFGLQTLLARQSGWVRNVVASGLFVGVLISSVWYTERAAWMELVAYDVRTDSVVLPGAPATVVITDNDLTLFAEFTEQRFLSIPWKGTAIGVLTSNYPVVTQPGTITHNPGLYHIFMSSDCKEKQTILQTHQVSLVYTPPFSCPWVTPIATSSEGLVLQQVMAYLGP